MTTDDPVRIEKRISELADIIARYDEQGKDASALRAFFWTLFSRYVASLKGATT